MYQNLGMDAAAQLFHTTSEIAPTATKRYNHGVFRQPPDGAQGQEWAGIHEEGLGK